MRYYFFKHKTIRRKDCGCRNVSPNDVQRRADIAFYTSTRWRRFRLQQLRSTPLCERCETPTPSVDCHHRIDRKLNPAIAFSPENTEMLCRSCHEKKCRFLFATNDGLEHDPKSVKKVLLKKDGLAFREAQGVQLMMDVIVAP